LPEGRAVLTRTSGSPRYAREVLIIEDREGVLEWYRRKGFVGHKVLKPSDVTVPLQVEGKYIYGDIPLSLAVHARRVFLIYVDGVPLRDKHISADELEKRGAVLWETKTKAAR